MDNQDSCSPSPDQNLKLNFSLSFSISFSKSLISFLNTDSTSAISSTAYLMIIIGLLNTSSLPSFFAFYLYSLWMSLSLAFLAMSRAGSTTFSKSDFYALLQPSGISSSS